MCLLIYALLAVVSGLYLYKKWIYSYWRRKGLYSLDASQITDARYPFSETYKQLRARKLRHGGCYSLLKPIYVPADLEIVKCMLVKNFDHFVNRGTYLNERDDLLSVNLVNMENEKWREFRMKVTPTFSSGKIKAMFNTVTDCTKELVNIVGNYADKSIPVDIWNVVTGYTIDIVCSIAFGIDGNTMKDTNSEFKKIARITNDYNWRRIVGFGVNRGLLKLCRFKQRGQETEDFFVNVIPKLVQYRESNKIHRNDFLNLLIELKNEGRLKDDVTKSDVTSQQRLSLREIIAHCFVMFVGSFQTSAIAITFTLLELALNQDIQEQLREEIRGTLEKYGKMTYDAVMNMPYLDNVLNEALRKHAPARETVRVCTKAFKVPDSGFVIEVGTHVIIPIFAIQRDPEYYPDPEKFDPERFSPENKAKRPPLAFIPFGDGPRICIGSRFGLLQVKAAVVQIIAKFKITVNEKTSLPIKYDKKKVLQAVEGGAWLDFYKV